MGDNCADLRAFIVKQSLPGTNQCEMEKAALSQHTNTRRKNCGSRAKTHPTTINTETTRHGKPSPRFTGPTAALSQPGPGSQLPDERGVTRSRYEAERKTRAARRGLRTATGSRDRVLASGLPQAPYAWEFCCVSTELLCTNSIRKCHRGLHGLPQARLCTDSSMSSTARDANLPKSRCQQVPSRKYAHPK